MYSGKSYMREGYPNILEVQAFLVLLYYESRSSFMTLHMNELSKVVPFCTLPKI
jgi:hypothetical protein